MLKILHTSDWHIGQTLRNYEREDEHRYFLGQLKEILQREQPHALVISGDVFHNSLPVIGAQSLLVESLRDLHRASPQMLIVVIAGNHDSGSRLEIHRELWEDNNVHIIGKSDIKRSVITLPDGLGAIVAVPYMHRVQFSDPDTNLKPSERLRKYIEELITEAKNATDGPIVLAAHLALSTGKSTDIIGGVESIPFASLPEGYDYLALGHIHLPHALSPHAAYSGSPFPMTFDEDYPHYVNIVEISERGATPVIRQEEIAPLRKAVTINVTSPEEAYAELSTLPDDCEDYLRVVVNTDSLLPADIDDRARQALKGKSYRFCGCVRRVVTPLTHTTSETPEMELDDFIKLDPMDIARQYFTDRGVSDSAILLEKLAEVIEKLKIKN